MKQQAVCTHMAALCGCVLLVLEAGVAVTVCGNHEMEAAGDVAGGGRAG